MYLVLGRSVGRVGEEGSRYRVLDITVPVASVDHGHQLAVLRGVATVVQSVTSSVGSVASMRGSSVGSVAGAVGIASVSGNRGGVSSCVASAVVGASIGGGRLVVHGLVGVPVALNRSVGRVGDVVARIALNRGDISRAIAAHRRVGSIIALSSPVTSIQVSVGPISSIASSVAASVATVGSGPIGSVGHGEDLGVSIVPAHVHTVVSTLSNCEETDRDTSIHHDEKCREVIK